MGPEGSEPAKRRTLSGGRYATKSSKVIYNEEADQLTLSNTNLTTALIKDIATGLGISSLKIESNEWLHRYWADPFPLKKLEIEIKELYPPSDFPNDLGELIAALPKNLETLCIDCKTLPPFDCSSISRLPSLKSLELKLSNLKDGIDFSKNINLENIDLHILGNVEWIRGIEKLKSLQTIKINRSESSQKIPALSIQELINKSIKEIRLSRVHCLDEELNGEPPPNFLLRYISGLKKIDLHVQKPSRLGYSPQGNLTTAHEFKISYLNDLESVRVSGDFDILEFTQSPKLETLEILTPPLSQLKLGGLPALSIAGRAS
jgi:hypothetical protein